VLFRMAQEALTNIERHAGASRIDISLAGGEGGVTLRCATTAPASTPTA
jgi:two-component system NarL family sensor kinase